MFDHALSYVHQQMTSALKKGSSPFDIVVCLQAKSVTLL